MKPIPLQSLDEDSRRLMAHAAELSVRDAYFVCHSDFLSPREQRLFYAAVAKAGHGERLFFFGGAGEAERRCAVLLPEWLLSDAPAGDPFGGEREAFFLSLLENGSLDDVDFITPVSLSVSAYASLSHRDWMGAILALGISRSVLGDIAVLDDQHAVAFFLTSIVPFITDTLKRAGSDGVKAAVASLPEGFSVPHAFERLEASVASPRLDGVVRALTNLSRSNAAALVKSGATELNYFPEENPDAPIEDGDILSIRGFGKFIIDSKSTVTRRGRNRLVARKYK